MRRLRTALWVVVLGASTPARAELVESFTKPAATSDGSTLGVCNQLTVRLFGGGSVNVAGNGHADISSPLATDAAFLASSAPLPQTGYTVRVKVAAINFPQSPPGGPENGVTLLAIVNTQPLPANEIWWSNYRMLAVEVDATADSTNPHPLYVNYWDASNLYTWNGTQWGVGDPNWLPVITYDPQKSYTVEIEKANNWYTIRVSQGTTLLTQATVPVPNVRPASTEYLVVGDRLTSDFKGTMQIQTVAMPKPAGCSVGGDGAPGDAGPLKDGATTSDAGVKEGGSKEGGALDAKKGDAKSDAGSGDGRPLEGGASSDGPRPDAGVKTDGPATAKEGGNLDRPISWDLGAADRGPDRGGAGGASGESGCDCRLGRSGGGRAPLGLILLAGLALLGLRRRR